MYTSLIGKLEWNEPFTGIGHRWDENININLI
jgi:hypothetical protein